MPVIHLHTMHMLKRSLTNIDSG